MMLRRLRARFGDFSTGFAWLRVLLATELGRGPPLGREIFRTVIHEQINTIVIVVVREVGFMDRTEWTAVDGVEMSGRALVILAGHDIL